MSKGFTMIEILTVIVLIGIMSAIAIPRFEKRIELTVQGRLDGEFAISTG